MGKRVIIIGGWYHLPAHQGIVTVAIGPCEGPRQSCLASVDSLDSFETFVIHRLREVKAEMAAQNEDR